LSGLLGVGGAVFYTPVLMLTTSLPHLQLLSTSILCCVLPSLSGIRTHYNLGNLNLKKGLYLSIGTTIGGILGSNIAKKLPEDYLKIIFSFIIFCVGLRQFQIAKKLKIVVKIE